MADKKYQLISFNLCPFVQRSVITLEERGASYERTNIDLTDKPKWFLEISPLGKVPVLKVDNTALFESAVINEFIDETVAGESFLPKDPLEKAYQRAWIEYSSQLVVNQYLYSIAKDKEGLEDRASQIKNNLARFEEQIRGPLFAGEQFSLVDAAAAPALQRLDWCESIHRMDFFASLPKVLAWKDALLARPSIKNSLEAGIEKVFRAYLQGKGSPTRDEEASYLGTLIS